MNNEIRKPQEDLVDTFFWSILPESEDHPDRRETGAGNKTKVGIIRVCERIAEASDSPTQSAIIHIQRAITLLQHDPDAVYALAAMIPDVVIRATERGETIDPIMGSEA